MPRLLELELFRLSIPFRNSYEVAFARLAALEIIVLRAHTERGTILAETLEAPQKTWERTQSPWQRSLEYAGKFIGADTVTVAEQLAAERPVAPRETLAYLSVAELCEAGAAPPEHRQVPLAFTIASTPERDVLAESIENGLAAGYHTFKLKIGFGTDRDLACIRGAQQLLGGTGSLRLDANQGLTVQGARLICDELDPAVVECLEQPFAPDAWTEHEELASVSPVPLVLDESIYEEDTIQRAAAIGVKGVKLKLVKSGSPRAFVEHISYAQRAGLQVTVGNGNAGDIACTIEASLAFDAMRQEDIELRAFECNGFTKTVVSTVSNPPTSINGNMIVPSPAHQALDVDATKQFVKDRYSIRSNLITE